MTTLIMGQQKRKASAPPSTKRGLSPSRALNQLAAGFVDVWAAQRDRWMLWLPVASVCGAGAWVAAPTDPSPWLAPAGFFAGAILAALIALWPSQRRGGWLLTLRSAGAGACALIAAFAFGAGAADLRARAVAAPAFIGNDEPTRIEGWVSAVDAGERGPRLRLLVRAIAGEGAPPRFVRLAVSNAGALTPGRAAICRGVLAPPNPPLSPGGYDFARRAYFERLGAVGFAYGRCRPADFPPPPSRLDRWRLKLAAMRHDLSRAIQAAAPGRGGAIAAAISTGDRSAIDNPTNESLRDSGLGHLLSVSGVHMAVVGGLVFAALRWLLALMPYLALRWPVKKLAAAGALAALAAYLIISGSSVPAMRAYVMAAVAFGAILLDRPAISMRGLALAALIVVAIYPESVLEPGFQMSFAATMALVALFEVLKRPPGAPALPTPGPIIGTLQWSVKGIGGVIGVSMAAGFATDPFAIYHFHRFAVFALPANLAAAPIMTFIVAPAAGAAAVLAPFGWAEPALQVMASGLDLVAAIGDAFGVRPDAVRALPKPPDLAMALCVFAMLWACLWRGALRWFGLLPFAASLALYAAAPRPALAFDAELRAIYAHVEQGGGAQWTLTARGGRSTYARDRLGAQLGLSPPQLERLAQPDACGQAACLWRSSAGRAYALVSEEEGFGPACVQGALVVTRLNPPANYAQQCGLAALIDSASLAREGGAVIYDASEQLRIDRANPAGRTRPWTRRAPIPEDLVDAAQE